ncbi:citron Rho-interacting kinase [Cladorrhinum sp. PSN259]|nr:citron Rho-interacting kinase [Cladorrhinum sp. PSN259]
MPKRPRKKSTTSKPAKRRPPSPEPAEEQYFPARRILNEKLVKGKILYEVDWEDHPVTGEKYKPTWEPAECVTELLIEAWEIKKLQSQSTHTISSSPPPPADPERNSQPASPAQSAHSVSKRQRSPSSAGEDENINRLTKRARTTADSSHTSSHPSRSPKPAVKNVNIVVNIPSVPAIDPSEYIFIPPSQSSVAAQEVASQRTIPDSQEDTVTQSTAAVIAEHAQAQTAEAIAEELIQDQEPEPYQQAQVPGFEVSHNTIEIPSHQPESPTQHQEAPSFLLAHQSSPDPFSHEGDNISSVSSPSPRGFLTQPDYDIPLPSQEVDNSIRNSPPSSSSGSSNFQSAASSPALSQAAQLVQAFQLPSNHGSGHFRTQSQEVCEPIQEDIISDTVNPQKSKDTSGGSLSFVSGPRVPTSVTGSDRNSYHYSGAGSDHSSPRESKRFEGDLFTPRHSTMDPPRDAVQELKNAIPKFDLNSIAPSPLADATNDALSAESSVYPDAVQELKNAIPKFNFFHPSAENNSAPPPSEPKYQSAVDELKAGMASARQRQGMDIDSSASAFQFPSSATPNFPAELPVIGTHHQAFEQLPTTIAPSDLTTSVELPHVAEHGVNDMFAHNPQFYEDGEPASSSGIAHVDHEEADYDRSQFMVTLPMAANGRAVYLSTIRDHHDVMIQFGKYFSDSLYDMPDPSLVAKMDALFERLQALCDLPAYDDKMHSLVSEDMMKHATNSNCKYSFVYEFLLGLSGTNTGILLVSQPGRVLSYLEAVVKATNNPYKVLGRAETFSVEPSVILADASQDLSSIRGAGIEVVILFDEAARLAELPKTLSYRPITILSLTVAYSLEHIEFQLQREHPELKGLEKKNALNVVTAAIKRYLENPERGILEPHEAATQFSSYIRTPEAGIDWDTHDLPEEVFDVWRNTSQALHSQGETSHILTSRKRHLDEDNEVVTKRPKTMLNSITAPISDLLRDCLVTHEVDEKSSTTCLEIPVAQLERLAAKIYNLENQLAAQTVSCNKSRELARGQEAQRLSWERTLNTFQPAYHEALKDRKKLEKECKAATEQVNAVTQQLEASKAQAEAFKEKIRGLEADLANANAALRNSSIPEVAKVAQLEQELRQERDSVQAIKDHAASVEKQAEYLRQRHQDSSGEQSVRERRIKDLEKEVARLLQRDTSNAVLVNQMHNRNEQQYVARQFDEFKAIIQDREQELGRLRQELAAYKSNRRETRSPRPGSIMSPRPSRGATAAGSRGTSPALPASSDPAAPGGMNYIGGNSSRLSHLRSE